MASQNSKGSKRRKVVTPPPSLTNGKETVVTADGKKKHSSPRLQSKTREYVSALAKKYVRNLPEDASLWDADTFKARKVAVELAETFTLPADQSRYEQVEDITEIWESGMLQIAQAAACYQNFHKKYLQEAALAAQSCDKITKLTQDLEEAQSEVKLEKINQEIAERLVEQAKQEKYVVELKSTGEKACLKRKIQELETELQKQNDQFKDALLDAEVDGYNKCVKKAKEKGLRYKKLLLDSMYDPIENQQEELVVHPLADNSRNSDAFSDLGNASDSTATIPTALLDPADPIFYRSMIEVFAKRTVEGEVGGVVSKKGDTVTLKPTSGSSKKACVEESHVRTRNQIIEEYKLLKDCKTELETIKKAAFILGYNKCFEFVGEGNVFDPAKHNFKAFIASEKARLGISAPASGNDEHAGDN